MVKNPPVNQERQVQSLGQKDLLEKEMATHSIFAWEILWAEEPWQTTVHGTPKESDMT